MLYQICHGAVSFADEEILHDINFEIRNTEKIAVVGRNGCGKTTLLKLIHGDVELDKRDSDEDILLQSRQSADRFPFVPPLSYKKIVTQSSAAFARAKLKEPAAWQALSKNLTCSRYFAS